VAPFQAREFLRAPTIRSTVLARVSSPKKYESWKVDKHEGSARTLDRAKNAKHQAAVANPDAVDYRSFASVKRSEFSQQAAAEAEVQVVMEWFDELRRLCR